MSNPAVQSRKYFLGIGGAQSGPFSESEVMEKIKSGSVDTDTLVWYEGLAEWQPANSISVLKQAFAGNFSVPPTPAAPTAMTPRPLAPAPMESSLQEKPLSEVLSNSMPQANFDADPPKKKSSASRNESSGSYSDMAAPGQPVFARDESLFENTFTIRYRLHIMGAGLIAALGALIYIAHELPSFFSPTEVRTNLKMGVKAPTLSQRETDLRKALSELQLKPIPSVATLTKLVQEKATDNVGKEALAAAVDYYRRDQKMIQAGQLLMTAKQPREAAKFFMTDPTAAREAEDATFKAYEASQTKGPEEKELLLQDIRLLLGPVPDEAAAKNRIQILERDFPNENHPYKYYLKNTEGKLTDIFSRLAFYFVNSLMNFIQAELPQIALAKRPIVELIRESEGGYRIIGRYDGEVRLNQDKMPKVHFVFWLNNDEWSVVETDLTQERKKYAASLKAKLKKNSVSADHLLKTLESLFRQQFPKNGLHETVSPNQKEDKSSY